MIVCLDTQVLIWGIKREAQESQRDMIEKTANFLAWLDDERHIVMVPSPVLGEFLMRIPYEGHAAIQQIIESKFIVPSFDRIAASWFARIWQENNHNRGKAGVITRDEVKVDSMIVAVAKANNASRIYSEDPHLPKFANGFIEVCPIPAIPRQLRLV